mmetsp:Transcript_20977/g.29397  ORF Transcript_20977/g.29397 Transcript_20977/m.29397 type:complete len:327 (+) Transcript_20977:73-1053(+)|eukprot:CAMPEP_0185262288 /NCGR_PEP_ID=MMETSP1359-20130426/10481_1 /TAXON_ID=552665 /ORGANISM="Bigelowiella longifila, Strain CCMP242" /LENGTH=326 /DNA_ID=CAMNT_0027849191 /DNA_START=34 /DNA_END=1014 /DNA_ORIENTATION=-
MSVYVRESCLAELVARVNEKELRKKKLRKEMQCSPGNKGMRDNVELKECDQSDLLARHKALGRRLKRAEKHLTSVQPLHSTIIQNKVRQRVKLLKIEIEALEQELRASQIIQGFADHPKTVTATPQEPDIERKETHELEKINKVMRKQMLRQSLEADSGWQSQSLAMHTSEGKNMITARNVILGQRSIERVLGEKKRRKEPQLPENDLLFPKDEEQQPVSNDQRDEDREGVPNHRDSLFNRVSMQQLLEKCRCDNYAEAFENAGHDDAAKILEASEEERHDIAKSIGMKPGHIARLKHTINTILQEQRNSTLDRQHCKSGQVVAPR